MVEPRPAKIPYWNTSGSNRAEPPETTPAPSKSTGWAVNDQPPSDFFNWLQYYTGAWFTWLAERILKGSLEHDLTINALTPDSPGAGGDLIMLAGDGNDPGAGGLVDIRAGDGVNGAGGLARLYGGDGDGANGGNVYVRGGASNTANGGNVEVIGGNSTTSGDGGNLTLSGGIPTNGDGGDVTIIGRNAQGTGDGGTVTVAAGDGATSGQGGDYFCNAGDGVGQRGGHFNVAAGNSDTDPGDVSITGGVNTGTGNGGTATFKGGDTVDGIGGDVTVKGGSSSGNNKDPGDVTVKTGDATGSQGGQIHVQVAEAGVAGSGTNSPTPYVDHDGRDILKQTTHYRYTQIQDSGNTKSGTRGVMRLVPKSTVPSTPLSGDVWPRSDTDQIAYHNGTRYHNMTPLVYSNADEARKGLSPPAGTSEWVLGHYFAFEKATYSGTRQDLPFRYTIPANSLDVGSIIRVRASLYGIDFGSDWLVPLVVFGSVLSGSAPYDLGTSISAPNVAVIEDANRYLYDWARCYIECDVRVRAIGANGRLDYGGVIHYIGSNSIGKGHYLDEILGSSTDYDTTVDRDIYPAVKCPAADYGNHIECRKFQVEII